MACKHCIYFLKERKYEEGYGDCTRYPEWSRQQTSHFCGEQKATMDEYFYIGSTTDSPDRLLGLEQSRKQWIEWEKAEEKGRIAAQKELKEVRRAYKEATGRFYRRKKEASQ